MLKVKHLILAITTLVASHSVLAIGASEGFYLAGQGGAAFNNVTDISQSDKKRTADKLSWGISGGYNYKITQHFLIGGEIGFNALGSNKLQQTFTNGNLTAKEKWYAVNLLAAASYIYQGFHAWLEIGPAITIEDYKQSSDFSGPPNISRTNRNLHWILGTGIGYQWKKWDFFTRYDHYFGEDHISKSDDFPKVNAVFGGIAYIF